MSGGVDARAAARGRSRDSRSCRTTSTSPSRTSARAAEASDRAPLPMVAGTAGGLGQIRPRSAGGGKGGRHQKTRRRAESDSRVAWAPFEWTRALARALAPRGCLRGAVGSDEARGSKGGKDDEKTSRSREMAGVGGGCAALRANSTQNHHCNFEDCFPVRMRNYTSIHRHVVSISVPKKLTPLSPEMHKL